MQKIPTLFQRPAGSRLVVDAVEPGCEWVLAGEGVASRKWDGTCCAIIRGKFYKRCEWDPQKGPAPASWLHHSLDPAVRSGHGWLPVGDGPDDWMHRKAWEAGVDDQYTQLKDGTYELVGPKLQKNVEGRDDYRLVPHGRDVVRDAPRTYEGLRQWLQGKDIEGLVFKHPDGRMAKIKLRDFGLHRPAQAKGAPAPPEPPPALEDLTAVSTVDLFVRVRDKASRKEAYDKREWKELQWRMTCLLRVAGASVTAEPLDPVEAP